MTLQQLAFDGRTRLQVMVDAAVERLQMFCPPEGYYMGFSAGKDSITLKRLADEANVKYDAHYNQTGIDPPELIWFMRRHYPDVNVEPYKKSMWQLIKEHGMPPLRTMRFCCEELKERGGAGRVVVLGIRAVESRKRKENYGVVTIQSKRKSLRAFAFDPEQGKQMIRSCPQNGKTIVAPIFDWLDEDVWAYIHDREIPYCSLYDEGFKRLGCIGCPMARKTGREKEFARWPKFKAAYIRTFDEMLKINRAKGRTYRQNWTTGQEVFDWWISA